MVFLSVLITYKYFEKRPFVSSFKAALWVAASWIVFYYLLGGFLNAVALKFGNYLFAAIILIAFVKGIVIWFFASGKIEYFKQYKTPNPVKTAITVAIIAMAIQYLFIYFITGELIAQLGLQSVI